MRCPRCGNENPETYRFCGMCGTSLLQAPASAQAGASTKPGITAPPAGTVARPALPATPAPRAQAPPSQEAPIISGPSFLGLNQPAPSPQGRATLSIDPHAGPSSRNLDYLLEDEEHAKGGAGKFILIVVALALAVGFGYLRWRNQSLPFLGPHAAKPSAATESAGAPNASSAAPSSSTSPSGEAPGSSQPGAGESPGTTVPTASSAPASASPTAGATQPGAAPAAGGTGGSSDSAATAQPSTNSTGAAPDVAPATTEKVKPAPVQPAPKPRAADRPLRADPVAEAQKYIYGKGVRQDCDRGLRLLKPVADQANPKAMIEMGALYSAGLCTPRDLPTSYRWFALALRKDPNNQSLQADLNKLWGEMTQPERQLAIKLSQ